jgi:hypothetical protein
VTYSTEAATPQDDMDEARRLNNRADHYVYGDGADPLVGQAFATMALVHATLALAGYTRDAAVNATCAHGTVGFCAPCLALVKDGGTLA